MTTKKKIACVKAPLVELESKSDGYKKKDWLMLAWRSRQEEDGWSRVDAPPQRKSVSDRPH